MIAHEICEALYALPGGAVEPRRRSIFKPAMFAIVGVVLFVQLVPKFMNFLWTE